ncbi:NB-ARC domain-containing protein [Actinoplanes sp. NPDC049118]|uniref:ATP-binding protein n=1 Tax=Actinoplanes sp. NPDC049118 TaxID=3155769 RepID=UPI0033D89E5B
MTGVEAHRDAYLAQTQVFHCSPADSQQGFPVPRQLPSVPAGFTGRTEELTQLTELLLTSSSPPVVVVTGMAGVGKTALAVRWAQQVHEQVPDGQLYEDLNGANPGAPAKPTDVLARFLQALGVPAGGIPADVAARASLYRSLLAGRRVVVVLDNAASAEQVRTLLPGGSSSVVVITSRNTLPGLVAREGARRLNLSPLPMSDALALLRELVGDRVTAAPEDAALLVRRCAGLPLALRIIAAEASRPHWSISVVAAELADQSRLDRLVTGDDPRADVRVVFSWSYRALAPDVARLWRAIGLFKGPNVTVEAAAVLGDVDLNDARRLMDALLRANLLEEPDAGRFRMHDLLREFAAERAAEDDVEHRRATIGRLCRWYFDTAAGAVALLNPAALPLPSERGGHFAGVPEALAWYEAEDDNILAAAQQAAEYGHLELVCDLPELLWQGWYEKDLRAAYLISASSVAVDAARQLRNGGRVAASLVHLGRSYREDGQYENAVRTLRSAANKYRRQKDQLGEANARNELGLAYSQSCNADAACTEHIAALKVFRKVDDTVGKAHAFLYIARLVAHLKDTEAALEDFDAAAETFALVDDQRGEAIARQELGCYLWDREKREESMPHLDRAAGLHESTADWGRAIALLARLGQAYAERRDMDRLDEVNQRAIRAAGGTTCRSCRAASLGAAGANLANVGRHAEAVPLLRDALTMRNDDSPAKAVLHYFLGASLRVLRRWDEAVFHLMQAQAITGAKGERDVHVLVVGELLMTCGERARAGRKKTRAYAQRAAALLSQNAPADQIEELIGEFQESCRPWWRRWLSRLVTSARRTGHSSHPASEAAG